MKLFGYVLRTVASRMLTSSLILLAVLQILDLLEVTPQIIGRGLGGGGIAHYALLRLPRLIEQAAPIAALAGCIFGFMKLASESAVVAMRAAGVSTYRMAAMAMPAALAMAVVSFTAVELVAPRTDPALQAWWRDTGVETKKVDDKQRAFRVGADVVIASTRDLSGRSLDQVTIYRRDDQGRLMERIKAAHARYERGGWRLTQPNFVRFGPAGAQAGAAEQMVWDANFRPLDVQALFSPDEMPSAATAGRALSGGGAERPPSYYATRVQRALAQPLAAAVMLLLAAPIALASFRSGQGGVFTAASIAAGLLFLVVDGMLVAMGESGAIAPLLAAWTAPLVFSAGALTVLLRLEG